MKRLLLLSCLLVIGRAPAALAGISDFEYITGINTGINTGIVIQDVYDIKGWETHSGKPAMRWNVRSVH